MPNTKVIVENIRGGGGAIATAQVYASKPDGKTILFFGIFNLATSTFWSTF